MANATAGAISLPESVNDSGKSCANSACSNVPEITVVFATGFRGDYCGGCAVGVCRSFAVERVENIHG